jgi:hypothetical protein
VILGTGSRGRTERAVAPGRIDPNSQEGVSPSSRRCCSRPSLRTATRWCGCGSSIRSTASPAIRCRIRSSRRGASGCPACSGSQATFGILALAFINSGLQTRSSPHHRRKELYILGLTGSPQVPTDAPPARTVAPEGRRPRRPCPRGEPRAWPGAPPGSWIGRIGRFGALTAPLPADRTVYRSQVRRPYSWGGVLLDMAAYWSYGLVR